MRTYPNIVRARSGATMIEVLVTLVILLVGLLGLAGMMLMSQRSELESYQRVQALVLVQDMVGRINANRKAAACYAITTAANGSPYVGTGYTGTPTCGTGTANQKDRAVADLQEWSALLQGAAEKSGTNSVGAMIGARGCITYTAGTDSYLVSIAWQGTGSVAAPSSGLNCATNLYDAEDKRRVVGVRIRIANLS